MQAMAEAVIMPPMTAWIIVIVRLLGQLPLATARRVTGVLATPMRWLMPRRHRIVEKNLILCFPELTQAERHALARDHFRQLAESVADFSHSWTKPHPLPPSYGEVVDSHRLAQACRDGRGLILFTGHNTAMELGARLLAEAARAQGLQITGIYRPLRNRRLEAFQNQGRRLYSEGLLQRDDLRGMIRHLRRGGILWYAPDQDFGPERSEWAPFFGQPTATLRAIHDLARLGRAQVMGMYPIREPSSGRVLVHLDPVWSDFPSSDPIQDLTRFNAFLAQHIHRAPSQYWWTHRRFKSSPGIDYE